MSGPVVGVTAYVEPVRFAVWETTATLLPHAYVEHLARAGGQPVLLPPVGDPSSVLPRLDALVLSGGGDLDPAAYGAAPHARTGQVRDFRDEAELDGPAFTVGVQWHPEVDADPSLFRALVAAAPEGRRPGQR